MTEGIAAERRRPMAGMVEHLLAPGAKRLYVLEGSMEVINMKIEMHRSPVAVEFAPINGIRRGFGKAAAQAGSGMLASASSDGLGRIGSIT